MDLNLEELAAVIEQLDKTEFTEFRYEQGDFLIHVTRDGHTIGGGARVPEVATAAAPAPAAVPQAPVPEQSQPQQVVSSPSRPSSSIDPDNLPADHILVTAPMLGTFYGAPKPGAPTFVSVGDRIEAGATVCIIEVMKLMNSVTVDNGGKVVAIYPADGELVEFGQPLFALKV